MQYFKYQAQDAQGKVLRGSIQAATQDEALQKLKSNRLIPLRVRKGRETTPGRIPLEKIVHFYKDLAGLLDSGLPMDRALSMTAINQEHKRFRPVLQDMVEQVHKGTSLSEAAAAHKEVFGSMASHLIRAGEISGKLVLVLKHMGDHASRQQELKHRLISALTYPVILVVLSLVSIIIILVHVIPKFAEIFTGMQQDIPFMTNLLLKAGYWVRDFGWTLPVALACVFLVAKVLMKRPGMQEKRDRVLLQAPLVGGLLLRRELGVFCSTLGMLLHGGVPLVRGLALSEQVLSNREVCSLFAPLRREIRAGESLSCFFREQKMFPPRVAAVLSFAEERGTLAAGLMDVGRGFQEEFHKRVESAANLFGPAVIILTGLFIGLMVLSMYSAIYSVTDIQL